MDFNRVKVDVDNGVALLTLNHTEVMNAISIDMLEGLGDAFDFIEDRANGVRCVVMTGSSSIAHIAYLPALFWGPVAENEEGESGGPDSPSEALCPVRLTANPVSRGSPDYSAA